MIDKNTQNDWLRYQNSFLDCCRGNYPGSFLFHTLQGIINAMFGEKLKFINGTPFQMQSILRSWVAFEKIKADIQITPIPIKQVLGSSPKLGLKL